MSHLEAVTDLAGSRRGTDTSQDPNSGRPEESGPNWGWRIEISADDDVLRITHANIDPEVVEWLVAEGVDSRTSP